MTSSALLSIGKSALLANYSALQTTGNNIANVNTPGYSRQQVELATNQGQFSGSGYFGKGVQVQTVKRAENEFLTSQASATKATASADLARSTQLQELEKAFPTGDAGLGYAANQLLNAFSDVASNPQDSSARQVVLERASELTARVRNAALQLDNVQASVTVDLNSAVTQVNALTKHIADLNSQIAATRGSGQTPNDLLDQRDLAINQLSDFVQVSTVKADDGSVSVFMGGSQCLVLGSQATQLTVMADLYDPSKVTVGVKGNGAPVQLDASVLTGGSITGLLKFQQTDMTDARNLLGQYAAAVTSAVNAQQHLGLTLGNPPTAGQDMFAMSGGKALAANTNTGTAQLSATVTSASTVKASDYLVKFDGTAYSVQRVNSSDPAVTVTTAQMAAGFTINGVQIQLASGAVQSGDSFLVQPLRAGPGTMQTVLTDPRGLAAASPVVASLASTNRGTLNVASLSVQTPITPPATAVQVRFNQVPGGYTYQLSTDGGTTYSAAAAYTGQTLSYQSSPGVTAWNLTVSGTPSDGDIVKVDPTTYTALNNGNANAMLGLRDALVVEGATITDSYADMLANVGVRVQGATSAAQMSATSASDAQAALSSEVGVNLDEEAARLMQYQQAYQAAAKMMQVAQTIFESILQAT